MVSSCSALDSVFPKADVNGLGADHSDLVCAIRKG